MFVNRCGSSGGLVNAVTASGTSVPDASTGMSSYFSKLIPVVCLEGSFGTPKRSRSKRGFGGPGTCFPSRQVPSPGAALL